jgi:hypothetical protein
MTREMSDDSKSKEEKGSVDAATQTEATPQTEPRQGKQTRTGPWIRRSVEHRDSDDKLRERYDAPEQDFNPGFQADTPIFELVSVYNTSSAAYDESKQAHGTSLVRYNSSPPAYTYMKITSQAIIHAVRSVVRYYPGQDLTGVIINVDWPYPILVHHLSELIRFRDDRVGKAPDELCVRERDAVTHLTVLLDFLEQDIMGKVREEEQRNQRGYITFDYFWVPMKPGTIVLSKSVGGPWKARVVYSIAGGNFEFPSRNWTAQFWSMDFNGDILGRTKSTMTWNKFSGEWSLGDGLFLMIVDNSLKSTTKDEDPVVQLIKDGEKYWKLMQSQCSYYSGVSSRAPHTEVYNTICSI